MRRRQEAAAQLHGEGAILDPECIRRIGVHRAGQAIHQPSMHTDRLGRDHAFQLIAGMKRLQHGQGGGDLNQVAQSENVVALCDVDWVRAEGNFKRYEKQPKYKDFRVMLDKEGKNIDAVTIGIPDHMHATVALACMQRGIHVYMEKPLTRTPWEARLMADAIAGASRDVADPARAAVPFASDAPVDMIDRWYPGPFSHPYPGVSNCRTDHPGVRHNQIMCHRERSRVRS